MTEVRFNRHAIVKKEVKSFCSVIRWAIIFRKRNKKQKEKEPTEIPHFLFHFHFLFCEPNTRILQLFACG